MVGSITDFSLTKIFQVPAFWAKWDGGQYYTNHQQMKSVVLHATVWAPHSPAAATVVWVTVAAATGWVMGSSISGVWAPSGAKILEDNLERVLD